MVTRCFLLLLLPSVGALFSGKNELEVLKSIFIEDFSEDLTFYHPASPTIVEVSVEVISITALDAIEMDYTITMYFRMNWRDPRLAFGPFNESIPVNKHQMHKLWMPDVYFINEKEATLHQITSPNMMILIRPEGGVSFSQRLTLKLTCLMKLHHFPLDKQTCIMPIESYTYESRDLLLKWKEDNPIKVQDRFGTPGLSMPEFEWDSHTLADCTSSYDSGIYSCITFGLHLKRHMSFYITQVYVPTLLVVVLSWLSFWLGIKSITPRVSLGILTVLTIFTKSSGVSNALPRVSYIKSIDIWLTACLVFVSGVLVELFFVIVLQKQHRKLSADPAKDADAAHRVDVCARVLFPVAFLCFNAIYWPLLIHNSL